MSVVVWSVLVDPRGFSPATISIPDASNSQSVAISWNGTANLTVTVTNTEETTPETITYATLYVPGNAVPGNTTQSVLALDFQTVASDTVFWFSADDGVVAPMKGTLTVQRPGER